MKSTVKDDTRDVILRIKIEMNLFSQPDSARELKLRSLDS